MKTSKNTLPARQTTWAIRIPAVLAEAEQFLTRGFVGPAVDLLRQTVGTDPQSAALQNLLGIALVMQGEAAEAAQHAAAAVQLRPGDAAFWFTLGRAHKAAGTLKEAVEAYRRAIELKPRYAEAHVSLGITLKAMNEVDAAIASYQQAIAINPSLAVAHANLGNALAMRAERDIAAGVDDKPTEQAIAAQARAAELDPNNATVQRNFGVVLFNAQRRVEAADAFQLALSLDNSDVEACLRLGNCLRALGDNTLGRELYSKWLGMNPPNAAVMRAFSAWLTRKGDVDEALQWGHKAIALDPDALTLVQMCGVLMQSRRLPEALAMGRCGVEASGHDSSSYPVLLLGSNYLVEDPQQLMDLHAEFGSKLPPPKLPRRLWYQLQPGKRLKIGYVSGDFISHSVSSFIVGLLELHDRARFEIFCYHNRGYGDHVTEHIKSLGHQWLECEGMSDEALCRRMAADGIDIAIDLAGHTENSRVLMFAMAPAPVQVSYLGYPTVSGVPANDFRITDTTIDPGDMPAIDSDQPLVLPRSMFCYRPDADAPAIAGAPGQREGRITFGSFNNIPKLTDRTLSLWAAAMNGVLNSRLLLKSGAMAQPSNREGIQRFMAARGIAPERLTLVAWVAGKTGHLELYNSVDVALDPFPYNGATTTCEALWMGVPVVSLRGRTHTSRMGASLLTAIGKSEWVADSDDAYVATAVRIAADADGRARWRANARTHIRDSALCDEAGFARDFEAALMRAWSEAGLRVSGLPTSAEPAGTTDLAV